MAKLDEAKLATRALGRHIDLLVDACLEGQGRIQITNDNEKAVTELIKHRLAFHLDDNDSLDEAFVSRAVSDFVYHVTQGYQHNVSSGTVQDLWRILHEGIIDYRTATRKGKTESRERHRKIIQETVYQLIDTIRQVTLRFSHYVNNDFRNISDLDERIAANEKAIKEAEGLNQLFDTMQAKELDDLAGYDSFLSQMLMKVFLKNFHRLQGELQYALGRLRENWNNLIEVNRRYQRYNRIIDSLLAHYENNPAYRPDISHLLEIPGPLAGVEPLALNAYAPLNDPHCEQSLAELAQKAVATKVAEGGPLKETAAASHDPVDIQDVRHQVQAMEMEPEQEAAAEFFEALPELLTQGPCSVLRFLPYVGMAMDEDIWLISILNYYYEMGEDETRAFRITFQERPFGAYDGNFILEDIVFNPADTHERVA